MLQHTAGPRRPSTPSPRRRAVLPPGGWLLLAIAPWLGACGSGDDRPAQATLGRDSLPLISQDGYQFKDFNRNGTLEPFEDWRRSPEARAADLVGRMNLAEKAGAMMHGTLVLDAAGTAIDLAATGPLVTQRGVNT
ncbi:MAG: hypothetical protein IIZ92_09055, partial [Aquincola sp.]|nr:hypothetical protein [Aquincola sp.]